MYKSRCTVVLNKDETHSLSLSLLPPVSSSDENWMEVAYGTQSGRVVVVVRHPENIGHAPQVFQSYHVHTCPILRVVLGEKHLISGRSLSLTGKTYLSIRCD